MTGGHPQNDAFGVRGQLYPKPLLTSSEVEEEMAITLHDIITRDLYATVDGYRDELERAEALLLKGSPAEYRDKWLKRVEWLEGRILAFDASIRRREEWVRERRNQ